MDQLNRILDKRAILFDLDGTVINSTDGIFNALFYMFEKVGQPKDSSDGFTRFMGPSIAATLRSEYGFSHHDADAAVMIYREYYAVKGLLECQTYAGIEPLLKKLKDCGKLIALATKKPEKFAVDIIEKLGLKEYFDVICGASLCDNDNSKVRIIERAMAMLEVTQEESVMIGDTKYDAIGANEARVDCIGVLYGFGQEKDLVDHGITMIAKDVTELSDMLLKRKIEIPFSPPDISEVEIDEVVAALRSGWITTGARTKLLEHKIAEYCKADKAVCLNSATAAMELTLRVLGIGEGDEVITSAYTYTASASVICHVGATPILIDVKKDSYEMDYDKLKDAITEKTKAIIPVDIAGVPCDYDKILQIVADKKSSFHSDNEIAKCIGKVAVIADAAHAFGASYKGNPVGSIADFTCFSFHAVKNLTTGEGGAVTFSTTNEKNVENIYKQYMLFSLHGQSKDALAKTQLGAWEYDVLITGYKCNMTDVMAAVGLGQLSRYEEMLARREKVVQLYNKGFEGTIITPVAHSGKDFSSSKHLYLTRLTGKDIEFRNRVIYELAELGISANVHYKPLPMLTAYKKLGYDITHYPNAYEMYQNELTLPLNTTLTEEQIEYIIKSYILIVEKG